MSWLSPPLSPKDFYSPQDVSLIRELDRPLRLAAVARSLDFRHDGSSTEQMEIIIEFANVFLE